MSPELLSTCKRCGIAFHPAKSLAELKLSYCGILCQIGGEGFTIESILNGTRGTRPAPVAVVSTSDTPTPSANAGSDDDRELVVA